MGVVWLAIKIPRRAGYQVDAERAPHGVAGGQDFPGADPPVAVDVVVDGDRALGIALACQNELGPPGAFQGIYRGCSQDYCGYIIYRFPIFRGRHPLMTRFPAA